MHDNIRQIWHGMSIQRCKICTNQGQGDQEPLKMDQHVRQKGFRTPIIIYIMLTCVERKIKDLRDE